MCGYQGPGYILNRVTRRIPSWSIGDEIMLLCIYCDEMEEWVILLGSNSF
jgi:hypothetical protein